jgi:GT2 family glycosyltransferase
MINCSIVLYNPNYSKIHKTIQCVLASPLLNKLYLIDNSENNNFSFKIKEYGNKVIYIFNNNNLGFGKAHNIALKDSIAKSINYHIIINPDVYFDNDVIEKMYHYFEDNKDLALAMPKLLNIDNSIQSLPKLLPTPLSLVYRLFFKNFNLFKNYIIKYELRFVNHDMIYETPIISGCFTFFNLKLLKSDLFFDEKYFMYFEDWDLSRRISQNYKTIYYPTVCVYHEYESGANKKIKLFFIYLKSAIRYFNKWGWFFDFYRFKKNKEILSQFK